MHSFTTGYWVYNGGNIRTSNSGALRDLVPLAKFKKRQKHPWRSVTFSKVAGFSFTLLKVTLRGCFSCFLNWTNSTKSRKTSHMINPFSTSVPLLYSLKTSENLRLSHVFRGYRSGTLVENGLKLENLIVIFHDLDQ